jgi:hypothetical protein
MSDLPQNHIQAVTGARDEIAERDWRLADLKRELDEARDLIERLVRSDWRAKQY